MAILSDSAPENIKNCFIDAVVSLVTADSVKSIVPDFLPYTQLQRLDDNKYSIPLYTGEMLDIDSTGAVDWTKQFSQQHNSSVMHLYSLEAVGRLLSTYSSSSDDAEPLLLAQTIITDFFNFCSDTDSLQKVIKCPSGDHATATRIKVLIKFLKVVKTSNTSCDSSLLREIINWLYYWSEWLYAPENYKQNNHGLMGSLALLHAGIQFKGIASLSNRYIDVACLRTIELAHIAFDKDGLCNENSVGYHNFNVNVYQLILNFLVNHEIVTPYDDEINSYLSKARNALGICVRQDNTIPPIGDSAVYPAKVESINSSYCFKDSGFVVIKNNHLYMTVICGSRTEIHKHVDDTSITLQYNGNDIFVDGGSYLYDRQDKYRISLESSQGHCGIFPEKYDGILRGQFVNKVRPFIAGIKSFSEHRNETNVETECSFEDGAITVQRRIKVLFPDEIIMFDSVSGSGLTLNDKIRQRFLLAPKLSLDVVSDNIWRIKGEHVAATIFQVTPCIADHYYGEDLDIVRGWYSSAYKEITPIEGVDFIQSGVSNIRYLTVIKLSDVGNFQQLSPVTNSIISEYLQNRSVENYFNDTVRTD